MVENKSTPIREINLEDQNLRLNNCVSTTGYIVKEFEFSHTFYDEDFYSTMYFWIITMVLFGIGALVFKRLKVHFADVL